MTHAAFFGPNVFMNLAPPERKALIKSD